MTDMRTAMSRMIKALPQLEGRQAFRMNSVPRNDSEAEVFMHSLFTDMLALQRLLIDVCSKSLAGLELFVAMLEYAGCSLDALNLRVYMKATFPRSTFQILIPSNVRAPPPLPPPAACPSHPRPPAPARAHAHPRPPAPAPTRARARPARARAHPPPGFAR